MNDSVLGWYLQRQIAAEKARRSRTMAREPFDATPLLSAPQLLRLRSPGRFKAIPAGRQSGKTDLFEKKLLEIASNPRNRGRLAIYASTSIKRAVATIWDELVAFNIDHRLGGIPHHGRHDITFPNAAKAVVTGVENKKMADDIRGRKKVVLYQLDECQDWKDDLLRYFYEKVIFPSLVAVKDSEVWAAGTGGRPAGWWYEVATGGMGRDGRSAGEGWERFGAWTPRDNPFLPAGQADELIAKACRDRGCDESDPSIQTEFFAAFVADLKRQIFSYLAERNGYRRGTWDVTSSFWKGGELPAGRWSIILASDVGSIDAAAYAVIGKCDTSPRFWLLETGAQSALGASAQVELARTVADRYRSKNVTVVSQVMDPGGGGKPLIIDLNQEHLQAVTPALKTNKAAACIVMRDGLNTGKFAIPVEEGAFVEELQQPEWDPEAVGSVVRGHFPDRIDACLYGYREAVRLFHGVTKPDPQAGMSAYEREAHRSTWR